MSEPRNCLCKVFLLFLPWTLHIGGKLVLGEVAFLQSAFGVVSRHPVGLPSTYFTPLQMNLMNVAGYELLPLQDHIDTAPGVSANDTRSRTCSPHTPQ